MKIELIRADITSLRVEAVVNAVHPGGNAIPDVGEVPVGSAVVAPGGNLLCRYVIHAAGPTMGEGDEDQKLRNATLSSLERAEEVSASSVAFPAISTGTYGVPMDRCARVMLQAVQDFSIRARSVQRVVFCLFGRSAHETFEKVRQELEQ